MSNLDDLEKGFQIINQVLESGKLTRAEMEGVKTFCEFLIGATDRALAAGPVTTPNVPID